MKKLYWLVGLIIIIILGAIFFVKSPPNNNSKSNMKITSTAFTDGEKIPAEYTCDGQNINPPLTISGVPSGVKSLVLIVDDPDAPAGTWTHWTLWNIPPTTTEIAANSVPTGAVAGQTSFGQSGYGGPCPPSGSHHYWFKLYALDTTLNLPATTKVNDLMAATAGRIVTVAKLIGLYR